ncbi:MAG: hypothetical protein ACK452_06100 [Bacteroidota bacterium]
MKKLIYCLSLLLIGNRIFSQAPPQGINYQAMVYVPYGNQQVGVNSAGQIPANTKQVQIVFTLEEGYNGPIIYQETQTDTTDQYGLLTSIIGKGTPTSNSPQAFNQINWAPGDPYLRVSITLTQYNSTVTSYQKLWSVPYALYSGHSNTAIYANTSGHADSSNYANLAGNGITGVIANPNGTLTFNYLDGSSYTTGPLSGIAGTTGPTGPQGLTGPIGPIGATGTNGATGTQGPTGPTGPAGTNGTNGATGAQGPTGVTGAVGVNGTNGITGAQGPTGATGAAGTNGTNGAPGVQGPTGATGAAGTNGTNGAPGAQGPTGATGAAGTNGTNGAPGAQGPTGATGAAGTNGTNGAPGATGPTGSSGINTVVKTTSEPAGANCTSGGVKIEYGLDLNGNGILDVSEINSSLTKYLCNGSSSSLTAGSGISISGGVISNTNNPNFISNVNLVSLNSVGNINYLTVNVSAYVPAGTKYVILNVSAYCQEYYRLDFRKNATSIGLYEPSHIVLAPNYPIRDPQMIIPLDANGTFQYLFYKFAGNTNGNCTIDLIGYY